jgi:TonB family protein
VKAGSLGRALAALALVGVIAGCGAAVTGRQNAYLVGKVDDVLDYDTPPVITVAVRPEYPDMARELGVYGRVVLKVLVLETGQVGRVEIVDSPSPILDEQAITAVTRSTFLPATKGGSPCSATMVIPFVFDKDGTYVRDKIGLEPEPTYAPEAIDYEDPSQRNAPDPKPNK